VPGVRSRRALARRVRRGLKAAACVLLLSAAACTSGPGPVDSKPHDEETLDIRARKDSMFRSAADSPIPADKRGSFTGLTYYDIKPDYHVSSFLTVDRTGPPMIITLQTSTNVPRKMRKVGTLGFTLGETGYKLTAFADIEDDPGMKRLFVPFGDLTNNKETYGGGRYLDLDRTATGFYDLDFNRAYHPYCVYNTTYECPVPPRENRLEIAIPAGEKLGAPK
jgi:uncharacterized protein (DUF1684 family)